MTPEKSNDQGLIQIQKPESILQEALRKKRERAAENRGIEISVKNQEEEGI